MDLILVYDDDASGREFRDRTVRRLAAVAGRLRTITFGRDASGKKIDANDMASVSREIRLRGHPDETECHLVGNLYRLRAELEDMAEKASDLSSIYWLPHHREELRDVIAKAANGNAGDVTVVRSVVGAGKSEATREILSEEDGRRYTLFVPTHALAIEYEEALPGSVRLLSPHRMAGEGLGECPSLERIVKLNNRGIPHGKAICGKCPLRNGCVSRQRLKQAEDALIVIAQHAHLRVCDNMDWIECRVSIIDEEAILKGFRRDVSFSKEELERFKTEWKAWNCDSWSSRNRTREVLSTFAKKLLALEPNMHTFGDSGSGVLYLDRRRTLAEWQEFQAKRDSESIDLLPILWDVIAGGRWVRLDADGRFRTWVGGASSLRQQGPVIVLDATAEKEMYQQIFPGSTIRWFPETDPPPPISKVVQFLDGAYPKASLIEESPTTKNPLATSCLKRICQHIRTVIQKKGIPWDAVGVICAKKVEPLVIELLPQFKARNILHYRNLRGLNTLKECKILAVIGVESPKPLDLAKICCCLFNDPEDPAALLQREFASRKVPDQTDTESEVFCHQYRNPKMQATWRLLVQSELVQAIGRARPYEQRNWEQDYGANRKEPAVLMKREPRFWVVAG